MWLQKLTKDIHGDEVLNFCNHKMNPFDTEGNCTIENCREVKVYVCKCQGFYRPKNCKVHANP